MRVADLPKYDLLPEELNKVDEIINDHLGKKGALIPVLQKIQKEIGFIPIDIQKRVAKTLKVPEKDVYGVATFYSYFSMIPRGKNNIRVCMGTACFVKGGKKIVDKITKELKIDPGQTTADRKFSLQVNRCIGACGLAPIIVINEKVYQKVNPDEIMDIVNSYKE
jgi:NADH:ubiquinone oxidoreductase subunit E